MSETWAHAEPTPHPYPEAHDEGRGSNRSALRLLGALVLGAVLVGGIGSLTGPGQGIIGSWLSTQGSSYSLYRFYEDGSFGLKGSSGFIGYEIRGAYRVAGASGQVYRIVLESEYGDQEIRMRLESPERLVALDSESGEETVHHRIDDWILTHRPSAEARSYNGDKPHLGCWQSQGMGMYTGFDFRKDGTLVQRTKEGTTEVRYAVDYSKVPFHLDITEAGGQVNRGLFEFQYDGTLRISRSSSEGGARPEKISSYLDYYPCEPSETGGDA